MEAGVIADIYHDNYLRMADTAILNFWQSISSLDQIDITITLHQGKHFQNHNVVFEAEIIFGYVYQRDLRNIKISSEY